MQSLCPVRRVAELRSLGVCVRLDFFDAFFFRTSGRHRRPMLRICHRSPVSASSRRFTLTPSGSVPSSQLTTLEIIGSSFSGGTRAIGQRVTELFGMEMGAVVTRTAFSELANLLTRHYDVHDMTPNQCAAANRRPAGQSDGSGNLSAIVAADRALPAAVAELGR